MNEQWRERLRQAVKNRAAIAHIRESAIARDADIAPETLSRVLNNHHATPSFATVVQIAHAAHENVGYLVGEGALSIPYDEMILLRVLWELHDAGSALLSATPSLCTDARRM